MRLRVLYLITELLPAGAERIVQTLATGLDPDRYEVSVACLRSPGGERGDGEVACELRAAGIPVVALEARGKLAPRAAARLAFELYTFRPHVLHAHLFHANLAARLLGWIGGGAKVVATYHVVERRDLKLRKLAQRATARLEDASVCVSQSVADYVRDQLGVAAPRVIPNGIDLERFAPPADPAAARAAARAELGLPQDALVIGAVGRLAPQKAPLVLLEAFERLDDPRAILVYAGEGPLESELRQRAAPLGDRVRILGFRPSVEGVLDALDVCCVPSRWEGFGLALAEALARGVPVIAANVDSLPDVMGPAGVLVPADDPASLADALGRLLADPAQQAVLREQGPKQAARFGLEPMRAAYEALYQELAGSSVRF
ncbi:MAG: glycosyltransferase [Planctomycetes bacterium]|nr:glycosyltransferase [Planctomycetota bacterium]